MQKTRTRAARNALEQVLDACDKLGAIGARLADAPSVTAQRRLATLRVASRKRLSRLIESSRRDEFSESLARLRRKHRLGSQEVLVMLILLYKRIAKGNVFVAVREVLETIFDTSYEVLGGLKLFRPDSPLRRTGVVVTTKDSPNPEEILDLDVKLADDVFGTVCREVGAGPSEKEGERESGGAYASGIDYLLDLKRLSLAYQKRACRVFPPATLEELPVETEEPVAALEAEIAKISGEVRARLAHTPGAGEFALVKIVREHRLRGLEELIVVTLLFQEMLTGVGMISVSTLIKVFASSERDLLRKRHLLALDSPLVSSGIVCLEEVFADKPMTGEAFLPQAVIDRILADAGGKDIPLDSDARLSFHHYLEQLDDSGDFFEKLS